MRLRWLVAVALCATLVPATASARQQASGAEDAAAHYRAAVTLQTVTRSRLGVLGDAFTCPEARLVAFRRSTAEPEITDQWYVASQLWADSALLLAAARTAVPVPSASDQAPGASEATEGFETAAPLPDEWSAADTRCQVDKGFSFLDRLWDYASAGYFPRSNPVGTRVDATSARYGDDNSLGGLALLAAAQSATDASVRQRYIHAAQREADFLRGSNLWDDTFGGGFWWNTGRGDSAEGKPAQTNALAALFFSRLYAQTANPDDRTWALRTLQWLDTALYDPSRRLYRWSVAYADIPQRSGSRISQRYFDYDQGLAIQAQLAAFGLDGDPGRPQRARDVGAALNSVFWSDELGGFNLEAGIQQVYTGFSAWASMGQLALFDLDGDPAWLDRTDVQARALAAHVGAPDGGYGMRTYVCVDRIAKGCETGATHLVVDTTLDGAAEAWAQHLEVALADRLRQRS